MEERPPYLKVHGAGDVVAAAALRPRHAAHHVKHLSGQPARKLDEPGHGGGAARLLGRESSGSTAAAVG